MLGVYRIDLYLPKFLGGLALGMVARRILYGASDNECGLQGWSFVIFVQ